MQNVANLEQEVRDLVNNPRTQSQLMRDTVVWSKLCSSLDVIGDAEAAFSEYLTSEEPASFGARYLILYGVLQAMIIQQDAVEHLHEALGLEYKNHPSLKGIREVRHNASGHPTKRGGGSGIAFNYISRTSMRRHSFDLVTTYPDGTYKLANINVMELIERQRNILSQALAKVIGKLKEEEMEHRKQFRDKKLVDTFPKSLGYSYRKIAEAIDGQRPIPGMGEALIKSIIEATEEFKGALAARGILEIYEDSVGHALGLVEYPLKELHSYFVDPQQSKLNSKDASIFLYYISEKVGELIEIAREIDEEYAADL